MTTSNISLKLIPANVPSLCIPRVFSNIPRDRIFRIVDDLGLGRIHGIDMVPKVSDKGEKYNRIFIHFTAWSTSKDAEKARQIALSGGDFKILYDDPYFWKVSASTSSIAPFVAPKPATPKPAISRPKLAFDDTSTPLPEQKHQYPSPESRREKYGPRPPTEQRQDQRPRRPLEQDQRPRRQEQRQDQRPRRPLEQDQRQDPVHSPQLKEDNAVANVNAAANLLDKLALDMQEKQQEKQQEPKEEPKEEPEQDIKLTISQLNNFYINDTALLPPPRRRGGGKNLKKGVAKTVVAKEVVAKAVTVSIEIEDENGLEEGEEVEDVNKVEGNA
jgi:hypothetical protein